MLKVRVIPTLLWKEVGLVKGVGFDSWRRVGPVVPAVRVYTRRDVDELVVLDITATRDGRAPDVELVAEVADHATVPLTFGGGIRSVDQIEALLGAGADKVAINTAAYDNPDLLTRSARRFGSQAIVASIDFRRVDDRAVCFADSGSRRIDLDTVTWARAVEDAGAGEILLTSIERDGTMTGYDLEVTAAVADAVSVPVIASGGAGGPDDLCRAVAAGAAAVAAASIFHFTEQTPAEMKRALRASGVPVRSED